MSITIGKGDIVWSYAGVITSMTANVFMLPFLVYFLDGELLGLWYVFVSLGGITSLFDFGFSATFARNVTYCWNGAKELTAVGVAKVEESPPNFCLLRKVLKACRYIYLAISLFALLVLMSVGTLYVVYVSGGMPGNEHLIAWVLYACAIFLNLYYGYYSVFLRGVGAIAEVNKNTVIARVAQIVVTLVLLLSGFGIIGACAAYLVYGTVFRLLGKKNFFIYEGIGVELKKINSTITRSEIVDLIKVVWHNAWRDGLVSLSNYLCGQAGTIVCSVFLSLSATGIYSLGVQVATAVATVSSTLYTAFQPKLQSAYINGQKDVLRKTMSEIVSSFVALFTIGTVLVSMIALPLLPILKPGAELPLDIYLSISLYLLLLGFRNCFTTYFSCTNRVMYTRSFVVSSVLCVLLETVFVGLLGWGYWGLVAGQIIAQLVYNIWFWPKSALKELECSLPQLLSMSVSRFGRK